MAGIGFAAVGGSAMRQFVVVALLCCASCQFIPGTQANLERAALASLEGVLIDSTDAKFRNLRQVDYKGEPMLCGEVNSKNRMGGYAGYSRFFLSQKSGFAVVDPQAGKYSSDEELSVQTAFDGMWPVCEGKDPVNYKQQAMDLNNDLGAFADNLEAMANER